MFYMFLPAHHKQAPLLPMINVIFFIMPFSAASDVNIVRNLRGCFLWIIHRCQHLYTTDILAQGRIRQECGLFFSIPLAWLRLHLGNADICFQSNVSQQKKNICDDELHSSQSCQTPVINQTEHGFVDFSQAIIFFPR